MIIKFKTGIELEVLTVHGNNVLYQGVRRDCLTFIFPKDTNINDLLNVFTPENCEAIWLIQEDGSQDLHENYTIRTNAGVGFKDIAIRSDIPDPTEVCWVSMAQSTVTERQIMQLNTLLSNR